ncbi:MAG TPA: hypothetical protein PK156_32180, partial [Polyangium sp.]|nr:hypothetical protein [Polyangium sp.]
LKVNFRRTGVFAEPSFTPGPGVGYLWDRGRWGVIVFPGFGIYDRGNITLSPQIAFHAFVFSAGLGYEFRFVRTNAADQKTQLQAAYPILTLGLSLPIQAWWQEK